MIVIIWFGFYSMLKRQRKIQFAALEGENFRKADDGEDKLQQYEIEKNCQLFVPSMPELVAQKISAEATLRYEVLNLYA